MFDTSAPTQTRLKSRERKGASEADGIVDREAIAALREIPDRLLEPPAGEGRAGEARGALERGFGDDHARPERVHQLFLRHHAAGVLHEVDQEIEDARLQFLRSSPQPERARSLVEFKESETVQHRGQSQQKPAKPGMISKRSAADKD